MSTSSEIIVDFDHTLVNYGAAFHRVAVAQGFIPAESPKPKERVKERIYATYDRAEADANWLRIQHECYTREIHSASIDPHATEFIAAAEAAGFRVSIVSHKSRTSGFDARTDLRAPAREFLREHRSLLGAAADSILFAETFAEKVAVLKARKPLLLVDDLESVTLHPELETLSRVLLSSRTHPHCVNAPSWRTVRALFAMIDAAGGREGFTLSKLAVSSKNQLVKIDTARGTFLAKIFPETAHGKASAENEFHVARALGNISGVRTPEAHAHFDLAVLFSFLPNPSPVPPALAYPALASFLEQTRDFRTGFRVADDVSGLDACLTSLRDRLARLRLDEGTTTRLRTGFQGLLRYAGTLPEENLTERFILSDFAPGNLVSSSGEIHFVDFEDAGMGNPLRFLCNIALHPRGALKRGAFDAIRVQLGCSIEGVLRRFPISYFEWILIILNCYSEDRNPEAGGVPTDALRLKRLEAAWRRIEFFSAQIELHPETFFDRFWEGRDG